MDFLALIGLLLGLFAIVGGQYLEGGALSALINGPAFLIVVGGTLGATLLQSPMQVFIKGLKFLPDVFRHANHDYSTVSKKIINLLA